MSDLLSLQALELGPKPLSPEQSETVQKLRAQVPAPVLGHFDRLLARGKKGVAYARNGTCSECHLRLPSGTAATVSDENEIHLCDHCGRYLYFELCAPPQAAPAQTNLASLPVPAAPAKAKVAAPAKRRPRRKVLANAV